MTDLTPLTRAQLQASLQEFIAAEVNKFLDGIVREIYQAVKLSAQRGITSYFYTQNKGLHLPLNQPINGQVSAIPVDLNSLDQNHKAPFRAFNYHETLLEKLKQVFPDSTVEFIQKMSASPYNKKVLEEGILIDWS
jgi:hypothetical protein